MLHAPISTDDFPRNGLVNKSYVVQLHLHCESSLKIVPCNIGLKQYNMIMIRKNPFRSFKIHSILVPLDLPLTLTITLWPSLLEIEKLLANKDYKQKFNFSIIYQRFSSLHYERYLLRFINIRFYTIAVVKR